MSFRPTLARFSSATWFRFQGETIAVAVAEKAYQAADAIDQIHADLEPLASAGTLEAALAPGNPAIHEGEESNLLGTTHIGFGDIDRAFDGAPMRVSGSMRLPRISGGYLEPRKVTAAPDGDGVVVWTSTQWVFGVRQELARLLDLSPELVRVSPTMSVVASAPKDVPTRKRSWSGPGRAGSAAPCAGWERGRTTP